MSEQYIKYPRTYHLPDSPSATRDDKVLKSIDHFRNNYVLITEKMDGENTAMYRDHIHARSVNSEHHESQSYVKSIWGEKVAWRLPDGYKIYGENLYAQHSIAYTRKNKNALRSYFYVFAIVHSITENKHIFLPFHEMYKMIKLYGLEMVPILYLGPFYEGIVEYCKDYVNKNSDKIEGFVIRNDMSFGYENFNDNVAKYVRPHHVTTDEHWKNQKVKPNELITT